MEKYKDSTLSPEERAKDLLSRMTLEEKLAQTNILRAGEFFMGVDDFWQCSIDADDTLDTEKFRGTVADRGIGYVHDIYSVPAIKNQVQRYMVEETRLGIPCIFTAEALHGCSMGGTTIFPVPLTMAQSFNPDLIHQVGAAIGAECRRLGHHEILAPNLDVARDSRWGRTEETFGEDTYLSSELAVAMISGEQKGDISRPDAVISEPKHYVVYGTSEGGINCAPARVGKREVETVYLPVFEAGITRGGAYNVMVSYNCIDGELMMTSEHYMKEVLKERWGMKGITRADWAGIIKLIADHHMATSRKEAVHMTVSKGLDCQGCLDLQPREWEEILMELIQEGKIREIDIDESVLRILKMKFELGLFENPYCDEEVYKDVIRCDEHKKVALQVAEEGMVLLKNDGVLPLQDKFSKIALIGPSSAVQKVGGYSSVPVGYEIRSVYDELKDRYPNAQISQCDGCAISHSDGETVVYVNNQPHLTKTLDADIEDMIEDAVELARNADVAVIVCGDNNVTSGEGCDRARLVLNGRQRELILRVAETNTPVVLVLENGKAVDLSEENQVCAAIVVAGFGGEFGAKAIVKALAGDINPAGRLTLSYPKLEGMMPCYYSSLPGGAGKYLEGDSEPLYSFGHGLSYTTFAYSDLTIQPLGGCRQAVSFSVTNTGNYDGDEVVQLYINDVASSIVTPLKLLRKFKRIHVPVGETVKVEFELGFDDFKLLDLKWKWTVEPGDFEIMIGASAADIRLKQTISIQ